MVEFPQGVFAQLSNKLVPHPAVVHTFSLPRKIKELLENFQIIAKTSEILCVDVGVYGGKLCLQQILIFFGSEQAGLIA